MRQLVLIASLSALVLAGGCGPNALRGSKHQPSAPVHTVDQIEMFSSMAGINFDHIPGADGVSIQVLLYQLVQPKPVTVTGTLEFLLFDGKIAREEMHTRQPLHIWRFSGQQLPQYLFRSMVGWGYAMDLRWGKRAPTSKLITVAVRYVPPPGEGRIVYSDPVTINARSKRS